MKLLLLSLTVFTLSTSFAQAECTAETREDFSSQKYRLVCDGADLGGSDSLAEIQKAADKQNDRGSSMGMVGCRDADGKAIKEPGCSTED
ncbi:MAG: hypothetical protein ACXWQO_15220 [Bdellovibrionota bacterium]